MPFINGDYYPPNMVPPHLDDRPHGTDGCYNNHACRCDECKKAHAKVARDRRDRKSGKVRVDPLAKFPHGTIRRAEFCNCLLCLECLTREAAAAMEFDPQPLTDKAGCDLRRRVNVLLTFFNTDYPPDPNCRWVETPGWAQR